MLQMENMDQKDSWVLEVAKILDSETTPEETHDGIEKPRDGLIHTVPKSLFSPTTKMFYLPKVICLGPYHFKGKEEPHDEMELLKTEVARNVHLKIKDGLKSVIECFKEKENEIKESYARGFGVTGEVCAWMITRDACFVVEVLDRFRRNEDADDKFRRNEVVEQRVSASMDRILSRKRHHPLLTDIVKDMLKMENQIPFWTLKEIRPDIEDWFESALRNLSPIKVARMLYCRQYNKESHILQLLHDYIVDRQDPASSVLYSLYSHSLAYIILKDVCPSACDCSMICCGFDLDYLRRQCILLWYCIKRLFSLLVYTIILIVLFPVLFVMFIIFVCHDMAYFEWEAREHVPTVEELKRLGVKFKRLKGLKKGISHTKFKESMFDSTLYLPQFEVDDRSEVILRNLIALEICSQKDEKPITRYVILMNDLINTSEDVAILRRNDIITSKLGSDEETAQLWNSLVISTEVPRYKPIDDAVSSIDDYRKKWWKVLWAQFIMAHCSKPWLFISLLAGLILLLLTFVQVVCLFASCQIR